MATAIPYEGRWKGRVMEAALEEAKNSAAVCLAIKVRLDTLWYGKTDEGEAGFYVPPNYIPVETVARVWIVGKDGNVSESGIEQLKDAFGWNGDWGLLDANGGINWADYEIQTSTKSEEYDGKSRIKCGWVYHADAVPGFSVGNVDASKAKTLAARYSSQTRALCGGKTPAPQGKPAAPSRQAKPAQAAKATAETPDVGANIPF